MFERFTEPGIKVVVTAQEEARKIGNNFVGTEQILLGLIAETSGIGGRILRKYGVTLRLAREEIKRLVGRGSGFVAVEIPFTPRARRVLENAIDESKSLGFPYVGPEHILLGVLMEDSGIAITALRKILRDVNPEVTFEVIRKRTLREMGEEFEEEFGRDSYNKKNQSNNAPTTRESTPEAVMRNPKAALNNYNPADIHPYFDPTSPLLLSPVLSEFTMNITQLAFAGEIDPVIGRDSEVERVLQILSRRRKNNPILLGEPGVGKTAVAEGLALQIIGGYVPQGLQGKNIITLDLGLIIAGSRYRGDFEKRLKRVISDIQLTQCYILVVDEVHTLVGAGAAEGSLDAANILKPALARGEFQCIGATTLSEYRKYIEPDAALARRFQSVIVAEPSVDDTINILVGIRDKYELHHGVQITQNALEEAVVLTSRYVNDRYLPDKAIDIIDEACARVRLGYELIPNICNEFEDQLASICREKEASYTDKDWLTALGLLRDEIKFVQQFLRFLYELIGKLKEDKKIWIIRGLQQRYQFVLKGIGPLLKEWDLVLSIYDNDQLIQNLKAITEKSTSKKSKINLPEPKNSEELEIELTNYREKVQNEPTQNFINNPPLDKNGNEYVLEDDFPKEKDRDFDEMNPFADQELNNIQKEIDNMEDLDRVDELQEKFSEPYPLRNDITDVSNVIAETIFLQSDFSNKKRIFNEIENAVSKRTKQNNQIDPKKWAELNIITEITDEEIPNRNTTTSSFLNDSNKELSAMEFRAMLEELELPFDLRNIPKEVAEAVQKKVYNFAFSPFNKEDHNLDQLIGRGNDEVERYEILGLEDKKGYASQMIKDSKVCLEKEKLWCLLSFVVWNKFLLLRNYEENEGIKVVNLSVGKNQVGLQNWKLYKKANILKRLDKVDLSASLVWRDLFHESLLEKMGKRVIRKFGYGYSSSNINNLSSSESKENEKNQNNNFGNKLVLSAGAKEFLANNPDWLDMDPKDLKFDNKPISRTLENSDYDELIPNDDLEDSESKDNSTNKIIKKIETVETLSNENEKDLITVSKDILKNHGVSYVPWVFASDIAGVVSEWTGIPVSKVSKNETKKLLNIEQELQKRVIGQPEAVEAIAKALRRGRVGLRDLTRPIASFFFSGPTGVGKTEVTKALAASYFGGESDMVRFDMSEFMERHTVSKLIGSPPGYVGYNEGGQLTEAVRRKAYVVVLFDEVEKAHPDVFNLLLQVLEDGRLSDSQGRIVDFKNTIIVMTSNLGAAAIQNPDKFKSKTGKQDKINFDDSSIDDESESPEKVEDNRIKELVLEELKGFFRPEFLNRIDEIVVFRKLTKPDIKEIASIMLENLKGRLLSKSYHLLLSDTVIDQIIEEGFDPDFGARPLRRVITNRLEDNLAATILEQGIEPGSAIWVNYEHGKYSINHRNFDAAEDLGEYYLSNQDNTPEEKPEDIGLKPKKEQIDRNTLI
jgi:ATP-dependent Clp protease ATP-binding subunit ClpA